MSAFQLPTSNFQPSNRRVLVIGLDGATFDLIEPWAEAGHLPHLARLMAEGAWGRLESTVPAHSAPAWATFATGLLPGRHGLYFFLGPSRDRQHFRPVSAESVYGRTLWDLVSAQGRRVGMVNVPMTYPPRPVNGYMIAGMPAPDIRSAFWPSELYEEVINHCGGYTVEVATNQNRRAYLNEILAATEQRCRAAEYLMEHHPVDLLVVVFRMIDSVMHHYWADMDPNHPLHGSLGRSAMPEAILSGYRTLDGVVGRLVDQTGPGTTVFLMSDHGFRAEYRRFAVNRWLRERGLLTLRRGRAPLMAGASSVVRRLGILRAAKRAFRLVTGTHWFQPVVWAAVDWSQTQVVYGPGTALYVNLKGRDWEGIVPLSEYEALRDRLIEELKALRDPETELPVVAAVHRREEIYQGEALDLAPDLVPVPAEYTNDDGRRWGFGFEPFPAAPRLFGQAGRFAGAHAPDGIFLAHGPQVRAGRLSGLHIADLAPTILYALGLPVPRAMDGRVRTELFDPAYLKAHPVQYTDQAVVAEGKVGRVMSEEDETLIKSRLQDLGYL